MINSADAEDELISGYLRIASISAVHAAVL